MTPRGSETHPASQKAFVRPARVLGLFGLTMITTSVIASVNSAPSMAEYGASLITIYFVVAFVFLIPCALISAELATGWPEDGGVFAWVREAFGQRLGFVAVWVQWANAVMWFPAAVMLGVTAALHAFGLTHKIRDPAFLYGSIVVSYWILTFINLAGMATAEWVAAVGTLLGRFVPIGLMALLAWLWVRTGNEAAIEFSRESLVPKFGDFGDLAFVVGAFTTFVGVETAASNAMSARNPRRDYSRAILLSAAMSFFLVTAAALAIAVVVPKEELRISNVLDSVGVVLTKFDLEWLLPATAILFAVGMFAEINSWISAPSRGLLVAAREGNLPTWLHSVTQKGVQWRVLVLQAVLVSLFALCIVVFGEEVGFWITLSLPTQIYLVMYFLMFASGVKLRYSRPNVHRHYRVPFGNAGMWFLAIIGTLGGMAAIAVGFVPIGQVPTEDYVAYIGTLSGGFLTVVLAPFVIYRFRSPKWRVNATPHTGQAEDTAPPTPEP